VGRVGPTQNFNCVGHSAFGPTNNWPVCSLILRKISRIGATRHQVLRLKGTNSLSAGAPPQTLLGERCPADGDPLTVFTGPTTKGTEGKGREGEEGRERKSKGERREKRWKQGFGPPKNFGVAPL